MGNESNVGAQRWGVVAVLCGAMLVPGCGDVIGMDPSNPARGPGQLVGNGDPVSDGNFRGGGDLAPAARDVELPEGELALDCTSDCQSYCAGLGLQNPVNAGICSVTWGLGLQTQPIDPLEACRRLHADLLGRYPTPGEIGSICAQPTWGDTVRQLLDSEEFAKVHQRKWADKLLYNNRAVNFERAFDMDELVAKTYQGLVSWDEFAAVTSAHPVVMRRLDTAGDRAEFMFKLFLGRPPYAAERSDMARLYRLWNNGYWEHPHVGRLPDAFIEFACVDDDGNRDASSIGECTSVLWGHRELTLRPDPKRVEKEGSDGQDGEDQEGLLWSGFLKPDEWKALQEPGRIIASEPAFWEWVVDETLRQYFGYDLAADAPAVRHELVRYLLEYNGDIRALHFAIATSLPYLQSSRGATATDHRWTYGPLKQIEVEGWVDSAKAMTGLDLSRCDHRLPHPEDFLEVDDDEEGGDDSLSGWAIALVRNTRWDVDDELEVETDYRNLARTLGGCPSNEAGGRFTTVSVLNTAVQEAFVAQTCGIGDEGGVSYSRLVPEGLSAETALDDASAEAILRHQQWLFLGREPTPEELDEARLNAQQCSPAPCSAEDFARPMCFAMLSSSEMLFY